MTPRTLVRMTLALERRPELGAPSRPCRCWWAAPACSRGLQQYAARVYGPVMATGLAVFLPRRRELLGPQRHHPHPRLRRERRSAQLARSRALRRAGDEPRLRRGRADAPGGLGRQRSIQPGLSGSYRKKARPSLIDLAEARPTLVPGEPPAPARPSSPAKGLHPVSRLAFRHRNHGVPRRAALARLPGLGALLALQAHFVRPNYFAADFALFPTWPVIEQRAGARPVRRHDGGPCCCPKLCRARGRDDVGPGAPGSLGGPLARDRRMLLETLVLGPARAGDDGACNRPPSSRSWAGRHAGWRAQRRDDGSVPWSEIARRPPLHTALGLGAGPMRIRGLAGGPCCGSAPGDRPVPRRRSPGPHGADLAGPLPASAPRHARGTRRAADADARPRALCREGNRGRRSGPPRDATTRLLESPALAGFHRAALPAPATAPVVRSGLRGGARPPRPFRGQRRGGGRRRCRARRSWRCLRPPRGQGRTCWLAKARPARKAEAA